MRLLSTDPISGITTYHDYDSLTGTTSIVTKQEIAPILDKNKKLQNESNGYSKSRELRHAAEIPITLISEWRTKEGIDVFYKDHWPAVRKKLNSNEYLYLRTSNWNV